MDDLISRDSLLAGIEELKESPWYTSGKINDNKGINDNVNYFEAVNHMQYLARKETIEIIVDLCIKKEPSCKKIVKHGHWINYGRDNEWVKFYRCSNCHNEMADTTEEEYVIAKYKYCPFCGAIMNNKE